MWSYKRFKIRHTERELKLRKHLVPRLKIKTEEQRFHMSSRRHSACCCVRLDDWIYKCACGKSKWRCGSRKAITGKWLILGLLDVATVAISIALVVRSEDTATEDQKDDVYSAAIFGFILVLMELPLIVLLLRGVGTAFNVKSLTSRDLACFCHCCCSREAFQWMLYGRQAFWFFEILALSTCTLQCRSFFDQDPRCRIGGVRGES